MRPLNTVIILVGVGLLLGCKREKIVKVDKRFEIPAQGYAVTVEESGSESVDALVRQLVSQRPAPYPSGFWPPPDAVVMSDGYSTPEVAAALKSLKEMGPKVFPELVKHLRDDRYSYSSVVAAWLNFNVGDAVVGVLCDGHYMHSGYKARPNRSGSSSYMYLSFDDYLKVREVGAWAELAKNKTRLEIQMDFIDWCILKENERGYVDEKQKEQVLRTYEEARQWVRKGYSEPGLAIQKK